MHSKILLTGHSHAYETLVENIVDLLEDRTGVPVVAVTDLNALREFRTLPPFEHVYRCVIDLEQGESHEFKEASRLLGLIHQRPIMKHPAPGEVLRILEAASSHSLWPEAEPDPRTRAVLQFLHRNAASGWTLAETANHLGCSTESLRSIVRPYGGYSQYMKNEKLLLARQLIANPLLRVKEVAKFFHCEQDVFTHWFTLNVGQPPLSYRKDGLTS